VRRRKRAPDERVVEWLRAKEPDILILSKGRKRSALERWFDAEPGASTVCLGRRHGPEMGGIGRAASRHRESHAD
jgi:hypothetical protein